MTDVPQYLVYRNHDGSPGVVGLAHDPEAAQELIRRDRAQYFNKHGVRSGLKPPTSWTVHKAEWSVALVEPY